MQRQYTVGEFKARFSEALHAVEQGDTVAITYGRAKRTVAMLTPPTVALLRSVYRDDFLLLNYTPSIEAAVSGRRAPPL